MTYIRVDPDELSAASTTLRSCASEAASIGHACASIGSAPSSPAVAGLFQQMEDLLRTADQAVQRVSGQFAALAGELLKRASTAATDAATAGSIGSGYTGGPTPVGEGPGPFIIGGSNISSSLHITGPSLGPFIIGGSNISSSLHITSPSLGPHIIGGSGAGSASSNPQRPKITGPMIMSMITDGGSPFLLPTKMDFENSVGRPPDSWNEFAGWAKHPKIRKI